MIEILSDSRLSSVQDLGRSGYMHFGIGRSGAMDTLALRIGNWLVGAEDGDAAIEIAQFPLRVRFHADCRYALTGALSTASLDGRAVPPWWSGLAHAGQTLSIASPTLGARGYLCVRGGVQLPPVLGARATDMKSGFGGVNGTGLVRGTTVDHSTQTLESTGSFGVAPNIIGAFYRSVAADDVCLRVMPASELERLSPDSQQALFTQAWTISLSANRIGYRLEGDPLHFSDMPELLSHGIVPGVIQVPGTGLPIVQLADANTCGGYPKVGVVIACDLWKLGQLRPGNRLRFSAVTNEEAFAAQAEQEQTMETLQQRIGHALVCLGTA